MQVLTFGERVNTRSNDEPLTQKMQQFENKICLSDSLMSLVQYGLDFFQRFGSSEIRYRAITKIKTWNAPKIAALQVRGKDSLVTRMWRRNSFWVQHAQLIYL